MKPQVCKYCEETFTPGFDHRGLINVCLDPDCQSQYRATGMLEPVRVTACVSWEGKHTPIVTVVSNPMVSAQFNGSQKRFGAGVTKSGPPRLTPQQKSAGKEWTAPEDDGSGHNNAPGSMWRSRLGEAHHTKR